MMGSDLEHVSDDDLTAQIDEISIFAKLSPAQKSRVVKVLQAKGHTVGFMGDGINDAGALRDADVGISVDTATDIAKESADIILLEKDLMVLRKGGDLWPPYLWQYHQIYQDDCQQQLRQHV
jgi:Mg2+-importing ATPase